MNAMLRDFIHWLRNEVSISNHHTIIRTSASVLSTNRVSKTLRPKLFLKFNGKIKIGIIKFPGSQLIQSGWKFWNQISWTRYKKTINQSISVILDIIVICDMQKRIDKICLPDKCEKNALNRALRSYQRNVFNEPIIGTFPSTVLLPRYA